MAETQGGSETGDQKPEVGEKGTAVGDQRADAGCGFGLSGEWSGVVFYSFPTFFCSIQPNISWPKRIFV